MSQRVGFIISDEAYGVIRRHATERKRGEFVSDVLLAWEKSRADDQAGILERIERKINRLLEMRE